MHAETHGSIYFLPCSDLCIYFHEADRRCGQQLKSVRISPRARGWQVAFIVAISTAQTALFPQQEILELPVVARQVVQHRIHADAHRVPELPMRE